MSNAVILTDVTGGIGTITLNKPWKLNAWDTPMRAEITAQLNDWNRDSAVRAVILTGAGDRAFCAGQDLEETEKFQSGHEGANWFQSWQAFYNAIRGLDKPCLAALNGVAAGSAYQAACTHRSVPWASRASSCSGASNKSASASSKRAAMSSIRYRSLPRRTNARTT